MELLAVSKDAIRAHVIRYFHDVFHIPISELKPNTDVHHKLPITEKAWRNLANVFNSLSWMKQLGVLLSPRELALDGGRFDYIPWWVRRMHYEITYGWLYDLLSGRDYELLDTSLTFALDPAGHLGLTFSYRNGQLVATGQDVDQANVALSVSY